MLTGEVLVVVGVTEVTGETFVGEVLLFTTAVLLFLDPFGLIPGIFVGDLGFLAGLKRRFFCMNQISKFHANVLRFAILTVYAFLV